ncbi:hypothetical protein KKF81_06540 [Candidatus Micrarchaeota archaeon]|nr:hypothetical protein [Candidatus Micrarchaeota archaeon]MBU1166586.1 hypothetical protein [Candidatus Micrarchaeota archaeon]MBU1887282.1 hypothetical protein [Candidatus Micrarchaeota archaeon]
MSKKIFDSYLQLFKIFYESKDLAHGIGHIRRVYSKAVIFSKGREINKKALALGAILHGLTEDKYQEARVILLNNGLQEELIEKALTIARGSQATAVPVSMEGKILHDAHLCEGGDYFIPIKALATAISRGYSIKENYNWVEKNIIMNKKRKCYTKQGKKEYSKKMKMLKLVWKELAAIIKDS